MAELGTYPREGLFWLGGWALLSAAADLISWLHRPDYQVADYILLVALAIGLVAISFFSATRMIEMPMTWRGGLRFVGTGAALFIPIMLALGLLVLAARLNIPWAVVASALLVFASLLPITFLPGWPVWQSASVRLIGPIEAFRATSGFRWSLFGASLFVSALNRAMPKTSSTNDMLAACTVAVGNGLVACVTTVVGLSIAVAAYRKMYANSAQS